MYTITNIEYGIGPWGSEFIYGTIGNPKPGETEYNVHSVTVIQGNGHNILVDTGIDTEDPAKRTLWDQLIDTCKGVIWALEQVDLKPEDIDTVILIHEQNNLFVARRLQQRYECAEHGIDLGIVRHATRNAFDMAQLTSRQIRGVQQR